MSDRRAVVWNILPRFSTYVRGMPDGRIHLERGVVESTAGRFEFPAQVRATAVDSTYVCSGAVRFMGHAGMLNLAVGDIEIRIRDCDVRVEIADPYEAGARLLFASGRASHDHGSLLIEAGLEEDGSEVFFYRYPPGTDIGLLRITPTGALTEDFGAPFLLPSTPFEEQP